MRKMHLSGRVSTFIKRIDFEGIETDTEPIFAESVAYFRENLDKNEENKKWLTIALSDLASSLLKKGKIAETKQILTESEKEFVETVGENAPQTKKCRELLASIKS